MKIILVNIEPDDYILACRAAKYQLQRTDGGKDAVLLYEDRKLTFYVKRNKASVTVRKC